MWTLRKLALVRQSYDLFLGVIGGKFLLPGRVLHAFLTLAVKNIRVLPFVNLPLLNNFGVGFGFGFIFLCDRGKFLFLLIDLAHFGN